MATTFSSAQMRERDKLLEEKHKKELQVVERKLEKLKRALDDVHNQAFELRNRDQQLAEYLGFSDINEVQRAIDVADHEVTFHHAFERLQVLEDEVKEERTQKEVLQTRCRELEELLDAERKRIAALEKKERRNQQEINDLNLQYDASVERGRLAQEFFKRDRRKFFNLHNWLCLEPIQKSTLDIDLSKPQKPETERRRKILREFGSELSTLLELDVATLEQKMKDAYEAKLAGDGQPIGSSSAANATSQTLAVCASSIPSSRQPLSVLAVVNGVKFEPVDTPKRANAFKSFSTNPNSSDTEDDSQAPSQIFKVPLLPGLPDALPTSSDTEDDSQAPKLFPSSPDMPPTTPFSITNPPAKRFMTDNLPSRPSFDPSRRKSDLGIGFHGLHFHVKSEPDDSDNGILVDEEPPAKKPRLSLGSAVQATTPQPRKEDFSWLSIQRRGFSTGKVSRGKKIDVSDENTPLVKGTGTVVKRMSGQMRLEDYTIYKGRGRYAKEDEVAAKTINAMYTINPEHNGGASHQYDEVVRDKQARMRMDAGDCDDCREWYSAIGPMPPRDRGPLWRSPSTTPVKRCKRHYSSPSSPHHHEREIDLEHDPDFSSPSSHHHHRQEEAEIEQHKKQISRHRQTWVRAQTPPGYWNIGFPDTQEAREINEKAEEMHRRKLKEVKREVNAFADGKGRWVRRLG